MAETIAVHEKQRKQQVKRIWKVFWILAIITTVEVALGISHPDALEIHHLWHMAILDWIFIGLTVVKAYYITWTFMHMEQEHPNLRRAVVWTVVFYISYMVFILLAEGDYIHDVIHSAYSGYLWDF